MPRATQEYNAYRDKMFNNLLNKGMSRNEARGRADKAAKAKFGYDYQGAKKKDAESAKKSGYKKPGAKPRRGKGAPIKKDEYGTYA